MCKPKLLFKYKPISDKYSKKYTIDILNNHRLYLAKKNDLNDPMEGIYTPIHTGTAGSGIISATDSEPQFLANERNKFRILSLSKTCFSPQMWAYYADSFKGICFGFKNSDSFSNLIKVEYSEGNPDPVGNVDSLTKIIENDFKYKHIDWSHEQEWRIIRRSDDIYLNLHPNDLACIIITDKTLDYLPLSELKDLLPDNVQILKLHIGKTSFKIRLLDVNYTISYNGSTPPFIDTISDLEKSLGV